MECHLLLILLTTELIIMPSVIAEQNYLQYDVITVDFTCDPNNTSHGNHVCEKNSHHKVQIVM